MQGSTASPSEVPFDSFGDGRDVDLELLVGRSVVASIASVRDDAGEARAGLGFQVRQDRCEHMAVIGISGQRLHMGDELAAFGAMRPRTFADDERIWASSLLRRRSCSVIGAEAFERGGANRSKANKRRPPSGASAVAGL